MSSSRARLFHRLARFLMRGVDATFILADLEEAFERDIERGVPLWSARRRHVINVVGSILNTWSSNPWFPGWSASWIDVKLGVRMLGKQPALTLVAVFALSIGIPVGLLPLHVMSADQGLPVPDGDEIVVIRNWDLTASRRVRRPIHDFVQWRQDLTSFEDLGFAREATYNVISDDGRAAPVRGAEVTASVFSLLRVPPLLGRSFNEADETIGAPNVVMIGYDLWQSRLAGDPDIVGKTIRIGSVPHAVVGVMPEGFLFPYRDHLWYPLRVNPLDYERGGGPEGWIMARLAEGVSIEDARSELDVMSERMASEYPDTHGNLQAQVLPYTTGRVGFDASQMRGAWLVEFLALLLLILVCGNVGILVMARVATRSVEIAVRTALGASRARVVGQLFVESLAIAILAAGVGLAIGQWVVTRMSYVSDFVPFWVDFNLTPRTVLVAISLAVLSAVVAGVVPALKATRKNVQVSFERASGGRSGIRFGTASSVLIVAEVAVSVWFLTLGSIMIPAAIRGPSGLGIETDQYLHASLLIPRIDPTTSGVQADGDEFRAQVKYAHDELKRRLAAEPASGSVAIANALPGTGYPDTSIELEGEARSPGSGAIEVNVGQVDVDYFDALAQPILNGRGFSAADLGNDRTSLIVNSGFVERVLNGRNPIGRRLRYLDNGDNPEGPWYEIVGVVGPLGMNALDPTMDAGVYQVVAPGELHPMSFAVRVGDDPGAFTPRLRAIAMEIDPNAMIQDPTPLDEVYSGHQAQAWVSFFVGLLASTAVTLSASGLYALMSFTTSERTREIGIRTALGARPAKIVAEIGRRACVQLLIGVVLGVGLCAMTIPNVEADSIRESNWPIVALVIALAVVAIGMLACLSPTRRGLRIRPIEALKAS